MRSAGRLALALGACVVLAPAAEARAQATAARYDVIAQSVTVPVFPGQQLFVSVLLPAQAETPLPAVLVLSIRSPRSAEPPAADALSDALLARGVAVLRLDLPPVGTAAGGDALTQPADDAFAVLQYARDREDIDGDRLALVGVGSAAEHATRAAALDEALRALVLLGARAVSRDTLDLPTGLPLMALPIETGVAPERAGPAESPVVDAAAFLFRHLQ